MFAIIYVFILLCLVVVNAELDEDKSSRIQNMMTQETCKSRTLLKMISFFHDKQKINFFINYIYSPDMQKNVEGVIIKAITRQPITPIYYWRNQNIVV